MRHHILSVILFSVMAGSAAAQSTDAIHRVGLNPMVVTRIPVAMDRLTTVRFPSPVSDMESALISTEAHPEALFLLSYQSGNSFFSLRALARNTNTTLNVTWKGQTYVFELVESRNPWLSVILDPLGEPASSSVPRLVPPSRLLGLLDTAKAYELLRHQHPAAVAGVEVARPNTQHDYGDYTIRTDEVFRFEREDTLVFRIAVSNKTSLPIQFVPQSLMVRVGQRFYYQSITDATGILAPAATVPIYFAITSSSDGSQNALSPKNDFMVLLNRLETAQAPVSAPPNQSIVPPISVQRPIPQVYQRPIASNDPPYLIRPNPRRAVGPSYAIPTQTRTNRLPPAANAARIPKPAMIAPPPVYRASVAIVPALPTPTPTTWTPAPVTEVPGPTTCCCCPPSQRPRWWIPFRFRRDGSSGFGIRFSFSSDD